jgi:pimeloyl-ACP methyl ester carboxylesterase
LKLTAEDFRQRYKNMPDGDLLALQRDDLVEVARQCYDAELARRGLQTAHSEPQPPGSRGPMQRTGAPLRGAGTGDPEEHREPVAVASFSTQVEASAAREILRSARIPCYLDSEYGRQNLSAVGLRLMVPAASLEQAREVLANVPEDARIAESQPWDGKIEHRFAETNGIRMHYVEAGAGPLVLLCHGFPESWYAWRHQLPALAAEGYRAVAPDLRGYGQTDRPEPLEAYDIFQLTGDIVGLVNALEEETAVIAGHDWGALIASHAALLRPDLFRGVALLGVPFIPRRAVNQSQWEQQKYPGKLFYQAKLRSPMAERYFAEDIRGGLLAGLWSLSGGVPPENRWKPVLDANAPPPQAPSKLPPWLTEADLDFLEGEFKRTGFTGGLNYYRNMDRNWGLTPFLDGAKLLHRTLFLAGEEDPVLEFLDDELAALETNVPNLWKQSLIPRAGHWIQQERPQEVNRALIEFLEELEAGARA